MADGAFGAAGAELVVDAFLEGEEASFFVLVDGETALPLVTAQDHKLVFDGDKGPNTGGMGAYSPAPVMTAALIEETMARIIRPTVAAMKAEGMPYKGVLYAGLMITRNRSAEHTSELQSLMRNSYAVFRLKKKKLQIL